MLALDDPRWTELEGGYRTLFDPRPFLARLYARRAITETWHTLWNELHHQGDVGTASFAAVPHLVEIYRRSGAIDWNTYFIVAVIEVARGKGGNPDVPAWLENDYRNAIRDLAQVGLAEYEHTNDPDNIRAILSILAIEKGLRTYGRLLSLYSEEEMLDIESHQ
ncbi:MAG: hypothetical protein P4L03_07760 [Terracidiphilus sp.]|nr:hypothetical protein [Terracidiphilus sp.]